MKIIEDFKETLKQGTANISELPIIINSIKAVPEEISLLSGPQMKIINKMLLELNSEKIFSIFSFIKTGSLIFDSRLNAEVELKYIETCKEKAFITEDVAKLMLRHYALDKAINICVDNGYLEVIELALALHVIPLTTKEFNKVFKAIQRIPGNQRSKSCILNRSKLTLEQRICGLNSLACHNVVLANYFYVTMEDLRALSFGIAIRILEKTRSYSRVGLSNEITIKDLELFLFPLMIKNFKKYEELFRPLRNRILNRGQR